MFRPVQFSAIKMVRPFLWYEDEIKEFSRETGDKVGVTVTNPDDAFIASGKEARAIFKRRQMMNSLRDASLDPDTPFPSLKSEQMEFYRLLETGEIDESNSITLENAKFHTISALNTWIVKDDGEVLEFDDTIEEVEIFGDPSPERQFVYDYLSLDDEE